MRTIYYNGAVYTGELPLAQAFVEEAGRFLFAGTNEDALAFKRQGDRAVELEGRYTRGMTVNLSKMDSYRPGDGTFVNYAAEADAKEFIAYFMRGLGYAAKPVHTMPRERGRDQNNIRTREEIL